MIELDFAWGALASQSSLVHFLFCPPGLSFDSLPPSSEPVGLLTVQLVPAATIPPTRYGLVRGGLVSGCVRDPGRWFRATSQRRDRKG